MSAVIEVMSPAKADDSVLMKRIQGASLRRYIWNPFKQIDFMGPLGMKIRNSLTLADPPTRYLERCQIYPLVNCEYNVAPHEQEGFDPPRNYGGHIDPYFQGFITEPIKAPKYAGIQAQELHAMYNAEFGLTVLEPLTGIEDTETVRAIVMAVQPLEYKLFNLVDQLKEEALKRISGQIREVDSPDGGVIELAELSSEEKARAELLRQTMLNGATRALATMRKHYGDFDTDVRAFVGSKKGRSSAADYDRFVADQLGLEVPTIINTAPKGVDPQLAKVLEMLAERPDQSATLIEVLKRSDEERARISQELAELRAMVESQKPIKKARVNAG